MPPYETPGSRLASVGDRALSTAEVVSIVLQSDAALADALLHHFGGLHGIANATLRELQQVTGIGPARAQRIKAALEVGRRLCSVRLDERPRVASPADAANLCMADMMHLEREELRILILNTRNRVVGSETIYTGSVNTAVVRVAEILRPAIRAGHPALIVVHNHPSGDPTPSPEDVRVTRAIVEAGKLLSIEILDHIIIGRQDFVSLKDRGLGFS